MSCRRNVHNRQGIPIEVTIIVQNGNIGDTILKDSRHIILSLGGDIKNCNFDRPTGVIPRIIIECRSSSNLRAIGNHHTAW